MGLIETNARMSSCKNIIGLTTTLIKHLQPFRLLGNSKKSVTGLSLQPHYHSFIGWSFKILMHDYTNPSAKLKWSKLNLWALLGTNIF